MLESIRNSGSIQIAIIASVTITLIAFGIYLKFRLRGNPKDKERRRRMSVNESGRLGDATISEVQENTIFYEYSVRGVLYTASQDVEDLMDQIPDLERTIGPVTLKYSPNNPANSIILCEQWSGLRSAQQPKPLRVQ